MERKTQGKLLLIIFLILSCLNFNGKIFYIIWVKINNSCMLQPRRNAMYSNILHSMAEHKHRPVTAIRRHFEKCLAGILLIQHPSHQSIKVITLNLVVLRNDN